MFVVNLVLAAVWLVETVDGDEMNHVKNDESKDNEIDDMTSTKTTVSVWSNLKSCFTSRQLGSVVVARLIYTWTIKATSYAQLGSFYEDMYGLEVS